MAATRLPNQLPALIRACELRRAQCERLGSRSKFAWAKAQAALQAHTRPVKKAADLLKVKNLGSNTITGTLIEILTGGTPVEPVTSAAQERAARRRAL